MSKSTTELLGEIAASERAASESWQQQYMSIRTAFTRLTTAIVEGAKAEGIPVAEGEQVVAIFARLMTKITDEREAGKVALIKASELPLAPPNAEPEVQS